jgi:hypothetical protein
VLLYHQCNQAIPVTDGMTVTSLPASRVQKISVTMDRLCQVMLNQKLLRKFSSHVKAKSREMKLHKMRTTCIR